MNDKPTSPRTDRWRLPTVIICMVAGTVAGGYMTSTLWFAIIGALIGFIIGWRIAEFISPFDSGQSFVRTFPSAKLGLMLSSGAWMLMLLVWGSIFTRLDAFHDQGGMIITFLILPLTAVCWLIGGPAASAAGRHALKQLQAGTRPETDRPIAQKAIFLSQALTLAFVLGVLWLVTM